MPLVMDLAADLDTGGGVGSSEDEGANLTGKGSSRNCGKRKMGVAVEGGHRY